MPAGLWFDLRVMLTGRPAKIGQVIDLKAIFVSNIYIIQMKKNINIVVLTLHHTVLWPVCRS